MDFFRNFVNQVFSNMPEVAKIAMVNTHLKQYMRDLERDDVFRYKFIQIIQMFIRRQISEQDVFDILDAAGGIKLTHKQIGYFCNQVYHNAHIVNIIRMFIEQEYLNNGEIADLSQFLVKEIDNAIMIEG